MLHFSRTLDIATCGPSTLNVLYDAGITSIEKLIKLKTNFVSTLERKGEKCSAKLIKEIKDALERITFPKIMSACCSFGEHIGKTVVESFINSFPSYDVQELTAEDIIKERGFGSVKSKRISELLPLFKEWLDRNPMCVPRITMNHQVDRDLEGIPYVILDLK